MNNDDTVTEENEAVRNRTIVSDLIDLQREVAALILALGSAHYDRLR